MLPKSVIEYRAKYRSEKIPRFYSGVGHAIFTASALLVTAAICLSRLKNVSSADYLAIPITLILGNLVEYWLHRVPLHHPVPGLRFVYRIHTLDHHRFFTSEAPSFETVRDFHTILFPIYAPILLVIILYFSTQFVVRPITSTNFAHLLMASGALYFLGYEVFHFYHHLPQKKKSETQTLPSHWLEQMRFHHTLHHNPNLMTRQNFNVTFPLCDWLFGTWCGPAFLTKSSYGSSRQDQDHG